MADKKSERELLQMVQNFDVDRQVAIRNAEKQYDIWRSQGHPEWAFQWSKYHQTIVDPTVTNWQEVKVPNNSHDGNFWKKDYKRPARYQNGMTTSPPDDLAERIAQEYREQQKKPEQRRNERNSYLMARLREAQTV